MELTACRWCAGMHKEYKVSCIDAEVLQAMVDKDAMPVTATAEASELSR